MTPEQQQAEMAACRLHVQKLLASKKLLDGAPLHPTASATPLRYRDGKRLITDGPFAETREPLGGYSLIEADSLDDAIAVASGFLVSSQVEVSLELRPIVDMTEVPAAVRTSG